MATWTSASRTLTAENKENSSRNYDRCGQALAIKHQPEGFMAQVIEFYIPTRFKQKMKWVPAQQRGKLTDFPSKLKKSA